MKFEKESKSKSTEIVLESIKRGNCTPLEIRNDIDISASVLGRTLNKLRFYDLIVKNHQGHYSVLDKTKKVHGINCYCIECQKIRRLLKNKEKSGEIYLSGTESDKRKIRSEK